MRRLISVALVALTVSACSRTGTPTAPTASPAPQREFSDLNAMAGSYVLTVQLDEACEGFPASARRRTYRATLDNRRWHFLPVGVVGGGFTELTWLGDLFSGELTLLRPTLPELQWNMGEVEFGGEPLGDGSLLWVSGRGPVSWTASGLRAEIPGQALVTRGQAVVARCTGVHPFLFVHELRPLRE
jgi:hypothetical protein